MCRLFSQLYSSVPTDSCAFRSNRHGFGTGLDENERIVTRPLGPVNEGNGNQTRFFPQSDKVFLINGRSSFNPSVNPFSAISVVVQSA
jgi:hypothetical protein